MNLRIKCDTPKEQVLVLRKFKKLVPECRWKMGQDAFEHIPFVENKTDSGLCVLYLTESIITQMPDSLISFAYQDYIPASDFLRDNWKLEEKSELLTKLKVIQDQVNELATLIKKESL